MSMDQAGGDAVKPSLAGLAVDDARLFMAPGLALMVLYFWSTRFQPADLR
jgi:hypothetical protein